MSRTHDDDAAAAGGATDEPASDKMQRRIAIALRISPPDALTRAFSNSPPRHFHDREAAAGGTIVAAPPNLWVLWGHSAVMAALRRGHPRLASPKNRRGCPALKAGHDVH